jgi:hypothetical protein
LARIAINIARNLGDPERARSSSKASSKRYGATLQHQPSVPKITVYKYNETISAEYDVRSTAK